MLFDHRLGRHKRRANAYQRQLTRGVAVISGNNPRRVLEDALTAGVVSQPSAIGWYAIRPAVSLHRLTLITANYANYASYATSRVPPRIYERIYARRIVRALADRENETFDRRSYSPLFRVPLPHPPPTFASLPAYLRHPEGTTSLRQYNGRLI